MHFHGKGIAEKNLFNSAKHLSDPFYLEGTVRISLRDTIARELVVNTLIHREFSIENPARLIIEKDRLLVENANRPHGYGLLDLNIPSPYPKNPVLAKIFHEIGYADELGSGIRNTMKYTKIYSGAEPQFIEKDIFQMIIPLKNNSEKVPVGDQKVPIGKLETILIKMNVSEILSAQIKSIYTDALFKCYFGRSDIVRILNCSDRNAGKIIEQLKSKGLISPVIGYGKGKYKFNSLN